FTGSPGMKILEQALEQGIAEEFHRIDTLGGVLAATEQRYQRSQIQASAHRYESQIDQGIRPIIGLNRYRDLEERAPELTVVRTSSEKKRLQIDRLKAFKERNKAAAGLALDALTQVVERGGNVFEELLNTAQVCSLGQITERLARSVGRFRPTV
ncbi:MAG: methylmalonyl-CoA mutase family protein, partial [Gammaproteobacteria bacterium]